MYIAPHSTLHCTKEGQCCRDFPDRVNGEQVETITGDWMTMRIHNGTCDYFDRTTKRCTIYGNRPLFYARWGCEDCKLIPE